ncbi:DUF5615 family PIN-like protein [Nocardia sp. NPDC059180]|uniref:DUF5615 family PIN-like protein n=1 Tax=Nocardia sp. NPDC059180 TaxID=3346761 RepID=UPI0036CA4938
MRFVVDAQLPPAVARVLAEDGHDAVHVCDIGLLSAPDIEIWAEALRRDPVSGLISHLAAPAG